MKKACILMALVLSFATLNGCAGGMWDSPENNTESDGLATFQSELQSAENSDKTDAFYERNGLYYANTKSKKFHYNDCPSAKEIRNENLYITEYREELINKGYKPCMICDP